MKVMAHNIRYNTGGRPWVEEHLPKEIELDIYYNNDPEKIEERIADAISEQTGWLIEGFNWSFLQFQPA
jgi:hypothetical protein